MQSIFVRIDTKIFFRFIRVSWSKFFIRFRRRESEVGNNTTFHPHTYYSWSPRFLSFTPPHSFFCFTSEKTNQSRLWQYSSRYRNPGLDIKVCHALGRDGTAKKLISSEWLSAFLAFWRTLFRHEFHKAIFYSKHTLFCFNDSIDFKGSEQRKIIMLLLFDIGGSQRGCFIFLI